MRRFYVLAIAVLSVYCLADAIASNGGEPVGRAGTTTFSADFINLPIIARQEAVAVSHPIGSDAQPKSPVGTNVPTATTRPSLHSAPGAPPPPPPGMTRTAALAVRVVRPHAPQTKPIAPSGEFSTPDFFAPDRGPPVQRVTVSLHSAAMGRCASTRWSQPDAAGVSVLVCN
jgi:hypothetical protein